MLHFGVDRESLEPSLARRKSAEFWVDLDLVRTARRRRCERGSRRQRCLTGELAPALRRARGGGRGGPAAPRPWGRSGGQERRGPASPGLGLGTGYIDLAVVLDQAVTARPAPPDLAREPEAVDLHKVTIRDAMPGLDKDALKELEQRLGTRLPGEYRPFLKRFNGGVPSPACFAFRGDDDDQAAVRCEVTRFLAVGAAPSSLGEPLDLEAIREQLADWGLPKRLASDRERQRRSFGRAAVPLAARQRSRAIVYYPQNDSTDSTTYRLAKSLRPFFGQLSKSKRKTPEWVTAIEDGDLDGLKRWLDGGGKLTTGHRGRTPLDLAVEKGRIDVVRALIARGLTPEEAFQSAMQAGQDAIMLELLGDDRVRRSVPKHVLSLFLLAHRCRAMRNLYGSSSPWVLTSTWPADRA